MKIDLDWKQRCELRTAMAIHRNPAVRIRAAWVLAVADGSPVARVARAVGVCRPTVYAALHAYLERRTVEALAPGVMWCVAKKRAGRHTPSGPRSTCSWMAATPGSEADPCEVPD